MNRSTMKQQTCFVCQLNAAGPKVLKGRYWQVDTAYDIHLNGLFFIRASRHIEDLENLSTSECRELGQLLRKFAKKSKEVSGAKRVLTMCLGLKDPHIHFWVIPYTDENETYVKGISRAVKDLADHYRKK